MCEPSVLVIVGTYQAIASTGVNQATRRYHQVPLGRGYFDDTKVSNHNTGNASAIELHSQASMICISGSYAFVVFCCWSFLAACL